MAGETVFMDPVECVQESEGCLDMVSKYFFYYRI